MEGPEKYVKAMLSIEGILFYFLVPGNKEANKGGTCISVVLNNH